MKKNPGRKERRNLAAYNRTKKARKKSVINERIQKWISAGKHGFTSRDLLLSQKERFAHRGYSAENEA